jgi:hypothetical protein
MEFLCADTCTPSVPIFYTPCSARLLANQGCGARSRENSLLHTRWTFQFKRMPFGQTNALATFQQAMNMIDNGIHNGK